MSLKMGVNLNKLNISLDQFNAVSSGKYNIGQLKLGEDGASVYRTNNHKLPTDYNAKIAKEFELAKKMDFDEWKDDKNITTLNIDDWLKQS